MKKLSTLFKNVPVLHTAGAMDSEIAHIQTDSRKVKSKDLFCALDTLSASGHPYIADAIKNGATAILCAQMPETKKSGITYIQVADTNTALAQILNEWYEQPAQGMKIIGITGTNGKTTVATLLYRLFKRLSYKCGLISTIENYIDDKVAPSTHTTPDISALYELLYQMKKAGCTHVFMECSSHAIAQRRIEKIPFTGCIFTNITHEHLDYHGDLKQYIEVKKNLFNLLDKRAFALANADDPRASYILQDTSAKKVYYSFKQLTEFKGRILSNTLQGLEVNMNRYPVHLRLAGRFNAYNALAVYATAVLLGEDTLSVLRHLSAIEGINGRFDIKHFPESAKPITRIIDYAHTPDALEKALLSIHKIRGKKKVITVIGCGGNRDKAKRPVMARIAMQYSNTVLLTSDNPRTEPVKKILEEMYSGVTINTRNMKKIMMIENRKTAIETAIELCKKDDILFVAGKGHETYQEIDGVQYPFNDKEVIDSYIAQQR